MGINNFVFVSKPDFILSVNKLDSLSRYIVLLKNMRKRGISKSDESIGMKNY